MGLVRARTLVRLSGCACLHRSCYARIYNKPSLHGPGHVRSAVVGDYSKKQRRDEIVESAPGPLPARH